MTFDTLHCVSSAVDQNVQSRNWRKSLFNRPSKSGPGNVSSACELLLFCMCTVRLLVVLLSSDVQTCLMRQSSL